MTEEAVLELKFLGALVEQLGAQMYPSATATIAADTLDDPTIINLFAEKPRPSAQQGAKWPRIPTPWTVRIGFEPPTCCLQESREDRRFTARIRPSSTWAARSAVPAVHTDPTPP